MSTYDMIKLEGKKEAIKTTTIQMLHKFPNWSNEEIAELTEVPVDFVEKIREGLKK